jgi:sterol desaturase/sphingolipid hydroxylase (fatty acid hydroxylase superfamily)
LTAFLEPEGNLFWLYLVSSLIIAFVVYATQYAKADGFSITNFAKFCLPKRIYAHKSAIVDYKYYFVNALVYKVVYGSTILGALGSAALLSGPVTTFLGSVLGGPGPQWTPTVTSRLIFSVLALCTYDLGVFLGHFLAHKIPFLWEFHKVHHSAHVLTPLTNYRTHPVDKLIEMALITVFSGLLFGVYGYLYSGGMHEYIFLNLSALYFAYLLVSNLRHSHIWISYGWKLSHILSSPAMHQIHHSAAEKHFDKNYALVFSFWDYFIGSLYVPKEKEEISWGLPSEEHQNYDSVWKLYVLPFKKAFALLFRRRPIFSRGRSVAES